MSLRQHMPLLGLVVLLAVGVGAVFFGRLLHHKPIILRGAVITQDADPLKQLPVANVVVNTTSDRAAGAVTSDVSGLFELKLLPTVRHGEPITLTFLRAGYFPYELKDYVSDKVYIVRMKALQSASRADNDRPRIPIGNVLVKYSVKDTSSVNIGSAVKTLVVSNVANQPCNGRKPCSPDGKWKASEASVSLDAGEGNLFQNVRASCISGPCPFTRVANTEQQEQQRNIKVTAFNWSDTATFLVEAEVVHPMVTNAVRESYPVIFGRALNFTLPSSAEGVSIQAELNGETIVFPLGPKLLMTWATCDARVGGEQARIYRCELKPGYSFR